MQTYPDDEHQTLTKILHRINMRDLPAMSAIVQELISLTHSRHSSATQLADIVVKDYALTNKVLQIANSPYYRRGEPATSILRAVTLVGFDALRDMAVAIGVFEDFLKKGGNREVTIQYLAQSYISAFAAQVIVESKDLAIPREDVFICALLHNLGKLVVIVYCPELHRQIEDIIAAGYSEARATLDVLDGLSFAQIGSEIARFWNFSKLVILSINPDPPPPLNEYDTTALILNLTTFSNMLMEKIFNADDFGLEELLTSSGKIFSLKRENVATIFEKSLESCEDISGEIREGLAKLEARKRLQQLEEKFSRK